MGEKRPHASSDTADIDKQIDEKAARKAAKKAAKLAAVPVEDFKVGDKVEVDYEGTSYAAVVAKLRADGSFKVVYKVDNTFEEGVAADRMRKKVASQASEKPQCDVDRLQRKRKASNDFATPLAQDVAKQRRQSAKDNTETGGREAVSGEPTPGTTTVLLFYQYVEPAWTAKEHKCALAWARESGTRLRLAGRMRIAREGFNCTLTGSATSIRTWCRELRAFSPFFEGTEFKLTHGLPESQAWESLDVIQADELVGYGLSGEKAPPLKNGGTHLEPPDFHNKLLEENTVVIDVRNSYEADIGRFEPRGGAEYINPQMRRSTDWPSWLQSQETQDKLKGKQVMLFCTGGIRCERASSLLNYQLGDQVKGVFQLQGGIDKYLKEYPDGGHWVGKNYVFDKRWQQDVDAKADGVVVSKCLVCAEPWDDYRQQRRCATCGVPVLVCADCVDSDAEKAMGKLRCGLCVEQQIIDKSRYRDEELRRNKQAEEGVRKLLGVSPSEGGEIGTCDEHCTRLFIGSLDVQKINEKRMIEAFPGVTHIQWLKDKETGKFYGSCFVEMATAEDAARAVSKHGTELLGRRLKVKYAPMERVERWPPYGTAIGCGGGPHLPDQLGPPPFPKCRKFFVRGVAPEATDDDIQKFFGDSVVRAARWMTRRETGEFRGCGHVEFSTPSEALAAAEKHGKTLLGKQVTLEWTY